MAKINQIQNELKKIDGGEFQKLPKESRNLIAKIETSARYFEIEWQYMIFISLKLLWEKLIALPNRLNYLSGG